MRCDWTGLEPVAFHVAAQIFTIRPKQNLVPHLPQVDIWAYKSKEELQVYIQSSPAELHICRS